MDRPFTRKGPFFGDPVPGRWVMNIGIIGTGSVGSTLAAGLTAAGRGDIVVLALPANSLAGVRWNPI